MSMVKDLLKRLMLKVGHVYGKGGPWSPRGWRKSPSGGGVQWYS